MLCLADVCLSRLFPFVSIHLLGCLLLWTLLNLRVATVDLDCNLIKLNFDSKLTLYNFIVRLFLFFFYDWNTVDLLNDINTIKRKTNTSKSEKIGHHHH